MTETGRVTQYAYDLNSNIVIKTLPNGDTIKSSFDALDRAMAMVGQSQTGTLLYNNQYGFDLVGNVTSEQETYSSGLNNRLVSNTYDPIYRLLSEAVTGQPIPVTTNYTYDSANNRTSKVIIGGPNAGTTNYTLNNLNQITNYNDSGAQYSATLSYDANGNRISQIVVGTGAGTDSYSYDIENRMVGVTKGSGTIGLGSYAYQYDYRTRRITRNELQAGGSNTQLIFSGGTSVQEYDNGAARPTVEYVRGSDYGGGVGGILYTLRGGEPSYTHENKRGDVIAKTDRTGSLTYQAQYQAFSTRPQENGSTQDRQKGNSKDEDLWGALNEGRRYRDLVTDTFFTKDPAGMIDGPNEYTYVRQNPWTSFDPEGLTSKEDYQEDMDDARQQYDAELGKWYKANKNIPLEGGSASALAERNDKTLAKLGVRISRDQDGINKIQAVEDYGSENEHLSKLLGDPDKMSDHYHELSEMDDNFDPAFRKAQKEVALANKLNNGLIVLTGGAALIERLGERGLLDLLFDGANCFVAGTLVLQDKQETPIEKIHVGDRVSSADSKNQKSATKFDPKTWKKVTLTMNMDGDHAVIVAIKPPDWFFREHAVVGAKIWYDVPDINLSGWATVVEIGRAPPIQSGKGRIVLSTIHHSNGLICKVTLSHGEPIEVTPGHLIYSVTRNAFVHAFDLKRGERVLSRDGQLNLLVVSVIQEHRKAETCNLEVEADHHYYVGSERLLVHNECGYTYKDLVRRFMSKEEYDQVRKNGFKYKAGDRGISTTSLDVKPVNPDKVKKATGADNADYFVDINAKDLKKLNGMKTKGGHPDTKIQEDIPPDRIIGGGRVPKYDDDDDDDE